MKYNAKRARKAKRKAAALAKEQQSEKKIELIPGILLQNIQLPQGSKQFLRDYYTKHPGDAWRPATNMDIAEKAGVPDRISTLISSFYIFCGVQNMLSGEIESLMDDFGLWIKGIRPALNHLIQAQEEFYKAMNYHLDNGDDVEGAHQQYMRDFDSFYDKAMRWMRIPKQWHPGEEPKLPEITEKDRAKAVKKGRLIVDTGWEEMKITPVELPDKIKREWKTYYISKLLRDETAEVVKSGIHTLLGAKRIAMELQRNDPNETYVIYEAHNKRQDTATLEPKIAVTPHGVVDGTKLADTKAKAKNHKQEKKQKQEQANE